MKQLEKDYLAALYLAALSTKWYQFRKRKHLFQAAEQYRLMYIDNENLSVSQHETPKVIINKEAKEVCCASCVYDLYIVDDYPCRECDKYNKFKPTG